MKLLRIYQEPITSGRDMGYLREKREVLNLGYTWDLERLLANPGDEYYVLGNPLTPKEIFNLCKESELRLFILEELEEEARRQEKINELKKELNKLTNCGEES